MPTVEVTDDMLINTGTEIITYKELMDRKKHMFKVDSYHDGIQFNSKTFESRSDAVQFIQDQIQEDIDDRDHSSYKYKLFHHADWTEIPYTTYVHVN